jgi:hypothetical protein
MRRIASADAVHVAVNGIHYLLTWNCTHVANAERFEAIEQTCLENGYKSPIIYRLDDVAVGSRHTAAFTSERPAEVEVVAIGAVACASVGEIGGPERGVRGDKEGGGLEKAVRVARHHRVADFGALE